MYLHLREAAVHRYVYTCHSRQLVLLLVHGQLQGERRKHCTRCFLLLVVLKGMASCQTLSFRYIVGYSIHCNIPYRVIYNAVYVNDLRLRPLRLSMGSVLSGQHLVRRVGPTAVFRTEIWGIGALTQCHVLFTRGGIPRNIRRASGIFLS